MLGCLPDRLGNDTANGLSTLAAVLPSRETFYLNAYNGASGAALAAGATAAQARAAASPPGTASRHSHWAASTAPIPICGVVNPVGVRTVRIDFDPTYFAEEEQYTAKFFHDFGNLSPQRDRRIRPQFRR